MKKTLALLMLLVQPRAVPWFILYIVILQQIESNLIYPRIVGQSVGLPSAWVLAAIVTGGGLFGIIGNYIGVTFFEKKGAKAVRPLMITVAGPVWLLSLTFCVGL